MFIQVIDGDAALSIWIWKFLITLPSWKLRHRRYAIVLLKGLNDSTIDFYPDYEHTWREWWILNSNWGGLNA